MLTGSGQGELEGKKRDLFFRPVREKRKAARGATGPGSRSETVDDGARCRTGKKGDPLGDSTPIREEKVKEAKRKKQNGDYDSQEVYRKIADRLVDLFGI